MKTFEHLGYFVEVYDTENSKFIGFLPESEVDHTQYTSPGYNGRISVDRTASFYLKTNLGKDKKIKVGKGQTMKTHQILQITCGRLLSKI